jgi:hypothetical protein
MSVLCMFYLIGQFFRVPHFSVYASVFIFHSNMTVTYTCKGFSGGPT